MHDHFDIGLPSDVTRSYRLGDYDFSVASDHAVAAVVGSLFAGCRVEGSMPLADAYEIRPSRSGGRTNVELVLGGSRLARGPIESAIDQLIVETSSRAFARSRFLFVHAGVVARDGVGVMLPGPPGHGKSTTVAGLVRAGFDFLSDEAAAFDSADGTAVHPFPRPMMLSAASLEALPGTAVCPAPRDGTGPHQKYPLPLERVRPGAHGTSCRVAFIVAPRYADGGRTELTPAARSDTLRLLAEQGFNLARFGADGFRFLADIVRGARCFRLTIGDLPPAVEAIRGLFEAADS